MILPKVRDPRFITIRRGGSLTDADHRRHAAGIRSPELQSDIQRAVRDRERCLRRVGVAALLAVADVESIRRKMRVIEDQFRGGTPMLDLHIHQHVVAAAAAHDIGDILQIKFRCDRSVPAAAAEGAVMLLLHDGDALALSLDKYLAVQH